MIEENEEISEESEAQAYAQRKLQLEQFAQELLKSRDEAIAHRAASGIEQVWRAAETLYDGPDDQAITTMMDYATGKAVISNPNQAKRSQVWINVTRGRCETSAGRLTEILFPVREKICELKTTPVPELTDALEDDRLAMQEGGPVTHDDGTPATMGDVAKHVHDEANKRMQLMELEIEDQLVECKYVPESRKAIEGEGVKLGTAIMKGPVPIKDVKRKWKEVSDGNKTIHIMEMVEDIIPSSKRVSCWNIFPSADCKDDIQEASAIWERDIMTPRELRKLKGVPGYDEEAIEEVLKEEPKRTKAVENKKNRWETTQDTVEKGLAYETWEVIKDLTRDELESVGCDCDDSGDTVSACVLFCNDRPIKITLNPLDTGAKPYDFWQWCKVSDSVWGIGIPTQISWLQRIISGAWRSMMDNAGDSSGANVVVGKGIQPIDGIWELTGKKLWQIIDDDTSVRDAFAQFQIENRQEDLEKIIDLALRFIDLETTTPTIFNGEMQKVPETLGATNIVVDSSNIAFRNRAIRWEDDVTDRHLTRYYDHNMQYNPKQEIKGDYKVNVTRVSSYFEKEQTIAKLTQIFAMKGDPHIAKNTDWDKATQLWYDLTGLDIGKTEKQIKAEEKAREGQPQPQAPQVEAANIRVQGDLEKAKMVNTSDIEELKLKYQMAKEDREHEVVIENMKLQGLILQLANEKGISIDSIKAALAGDAMKLQTQKELSAMNGHAKQVAVPPTEPIGRAPSGEAYQK